MLAAARRFVRPMIRYKQASALQRRWYLRRNPLLAGTSLAGTLYLSFSTPTVDDEDVMANAGAAVRFFRSIKIGMVITMDYYFSMLGLTEGEPNYEVMMNRVHRRSAERMLAGCLVNGGTYIKIGQGLVSLNHILPGEYIDVLTQLQNKCLERHEGELRELFMQDFGRTPEQMYASFRSEPIAAASLAQVYDARTKNGERVAVKVQYIDLQSRFVSDVRTIDFLLKIAGYVHPNFDFAWLMKDVKESLKEELDFYNEGRNAERCARDLAHLKYIHIPKVYWELCSKRVLVTEFVDAVKINETEALLAQGMSLADINTKLFQAFGEQIFQTGFVHADPHPGNVLVRIHNKSVQLVLLDHGLYQQVSDDTRESLSHFWKAMVIQDHKEMKVHADKLGVSDYAMLAEILTQRPLKSRQFKLTKLTEEELRYMQEFAQKRFDLVMTTLREMPGSLLFVVRNLNTIRSIAHAHGDPIDRYTVLARAATKHAFSTKYVYSNVMAIPGRIYFEFKLLSAKMWMLFTKSVLRIMYYLGRAPDTSKLLSRMA